MFSEKQIQELIKNTPKSITTLVDSQSHNRFVEGECDLKTIAGITFTYNKWSLSGTHFMLVLAGSIANGTAITTADIFAEYTIPDYIIDKIVALFSNVIEVKTLSFRDSGGTGQTSTAYLKKSAGKLTINSTGITLTADRNFRLQFDLLIDND